MAYQTVHALIFDTNVSQCKISQKSSDQHYIQLKFGRLTATIMEIKNTMYKCNTMFTER